MPPVPHNGGDGTSASSVGTSSPDIFQSREHINNNNNNKEGFSLIKLREGTKNDVIVTRNDLNSGELNLICGFSHEYCFKFNTCGRLQMVDKL